MFQGIYQNRRVLVTGHTGFKGSWLCAWLNSLGAEVGGLALKPDQTPDHFSLLKTPLHSEICDIRNAEGVKRILTDFQPEIVFHLAAQPLVRASYREPRGTFETNVMGTVNLLDACRFTPSVRAVVVVTTDKCYANPENGRPFTEDDPLGGYDPYSASKGAAEIAAASYRSAFFSSADSPTVATARAGNVIGGGDWALDRLIPDLIRAAAAGKAAEIRSPNAVRPWQHVLEALSGYLTLGAALLSGGQTAASAWNFGPLEAEAFTVGDIIEIARSEWNKICCRADDNTDQVHEAARLLLDCRKAQKLLRWRPVWNTEHAVRRTVNWYRDFYENVNLITLSDLESYCADARKAGLEWAQ
ncbi:MAG: CDP-glucose 4,6-dehydratase [Lentisphaeria bacterium]|nr:CDP-glucose 4,6-dehydratase [Lentisphaeria bacterium]